MLRNYTDIFSNNQLILDYFATKTAGSNTDRTKDSPGNHFGPKLSDGSLAKPGSNIYLQTHAKGYFFAGNNTKMGRDRRIYSLISGVVKYETKIVRNKHKAAKYSKQRRRFISVYSI